MTSYRDWKEIHLSPAEVNAAREFAKGEDQRVGGKPWSVYLSGPRGEQNTVGAFGQYAAHRALTELRVPHRFSEFGAPYDLAIPGVGTADVKTKAVKTQPHPVHVVDLIEKQISNAVNLYIFCYWFERSRSAPSIFILGWLDKETFLEKAQFYKEGETRLGRQAVKWTVKADCRLLEIRELWPLSELTARLSSQLTLF